MKTFYFLKTERLVGLHWNVIFNVIGSPKQCDFDISLKTYFTKSQHNLNLLTKDVNNQMNRTKRAITISLVLLQLF